MEAMQQDRPPSYANHDPRSLVLPSVPTHELPHHSAPNAHINLPDLKSLGLPTGRPAPLSLHHSHQTPSWGSSAPHSYGYIPAHHPYASSTLPPPSPMETESVMSDGRRFRAPSIMSLDDPETREAAETLSGLRNMDFKRSSSTISSSATTIQPISRDEVSAKSAEHLIDDDQEPLLSLITASHPWVGGIANASVYTYNSTMHYTPAFIQSLIEKPVSTVASGLGTVSRKTGVESRVRQYFGDTPERRSAREIARASHKRPREQDSEHDDLEKGLAMSRPHSRQRSRTGSQTSFAETLPAYDENTAPAYEKHAQLAVQLPQQNWKSKVWITTSGLGVALSDTSLRSLKYCLSLLRQASSHLTEIMSALRSLLVEYEQTVFGSQAQEINPSDQSRVNLTADQEAASRAIAERIKALGTDIMTTLQVVTSNVSRYTGGALPENAGALVRRQLLSVPQRWRVAEEASGETSNCANGSSATKNNEALRTGQRWLVFAEQGCDMIAQVGMVVSGTVESAERWLDSMGRRRTSVSSSNDNRVLRGMGSPVMINGNNEKLIESLGLQMTEKR